MCLLACVWGLLSRALGRFERRLVCVEGVEFALFWLPGFGGLGCLCFMAALTSEGLAEGVSIGGRFIGPCDESNSGGIL